jgi:hypothetical protein
MKVAALVAFCVMFALQSVGQQELGSTSATTSIPTGSDRSQEIRAQNNPIVKLYAEQIKTLKLGSVDFLGKLDVYQKAYSRAPKGTTAVSSLQISDLSAGGTSAATAQEPMILKAARELLIAYRVSEKQNIKMNELIRERAKTPGLVEAVANIMATGKPGKQNTTTGAKEKTLNMEMIAPEVKDSAVNSIMSACKELSFNCQVAQK